MEIPGNCAGNGTSTTDRRSSFPLARASGRAWPDGLQGGANRLRSADTPEPVQLRLDPHAITMRFADYLEGGHAGLQILRRDVDALECAGGEVERPDLHRRDAHLEELRRELGRPL